MGDLLLGLPEMRDEDMPRGWVAMRDAAEMLGLSPFDGFNCQDLPNGGQAYWRVCRETGGTAGMALVHGPDDYPRTPAAALGRLFRGTIADVRAYIEGSGVELDPLTTWGLRAPGDA